MAPLGGDGCRASRAESDRLAREAERMEQELERILAVQAAAAQAESHAVETANALGSRGAAGTKWRAAAEEPQDEEDFLESLRHMSTPRVAGRPRARRSSSQGSRIAVGAAGALATERPTSSSSSRQEHPPARVRPKPGEWLGIAAFLEDVGLGRCGYEQLFLEQGIDSPAALAVLDPPKLRKFGMPHRHAMKLRGGIAELRHANSDAAAAVPLAAPATPRASSVSTGQSRVRSRQSTISYRPPPAPGLDPHRGRPQPRGRRSADVMPAPPRAVIR